MKIIAIFIFILGLAMSVFAWFFFYTDDIKMIVLASLYVAQFISILMMALGIGVYIDKRSKKDD